MTDPIRELLLDPERLKALGAQLKRHHAELRAELVALRAEPGRDLMSHCLTFCGHLREHHTNEDRAFGAFEAQFPDLAPAIARLRDEHRAIAGTIAEIERTGVTDGLLERLDAHFAYEERHLASW